MDREGVSLLSPASKFWLPILNQSLTAHLGMLNIRLTQRNTPVKPSFAEAKSLQGCAPLICAFGFKEPIEILSGAQGFSSSAFLMRGCLKPVRRGFRDFRFTNTVAYPRPSLLGWLP